jgi:hypothetical protein
LRGWSDRPALGYSGLSDSIQTDFVGGDRWQPADEGDELPGLPVAGLGPDTRAERRHPREAHAVLDDVEQLPVGQLLRCALRKSGGFGNKPLPNAVFCPLPSFPWHRAQ